MARILRGDVFWANLNPVEGSEQAGLRPVIVLSNSKFNQNSGTIIAVAVTSKQPRAGFPLTLELTDSQLPKKSWVKISQIRTLSILRLGKQIGTASSGELDQIIEGLHRIIAQGE